MIKKMVLFLAIVLNCNVLSAAEITKSLTVNVDNRPVMTLSTPQDWTAEVFNGQTFINPGKLEARIQLCNVSGAKTVEAAEAKLIEVIKSQVTDFKIKEVRALTIAGKPGKHFIGTGAEADDGDPSIAEVFIFQFGDTLFILCVHGEGSGAAEARENILSMLASAKKP